MSSAQQINDHNNEVESKTVEIKAALQNQVEFYFSPDNLSRDTYLRSLMSDDQIVPINEICKFRKVSQLCPDPELLKKLLIESLADSKICIVTNDSLGIKPLPRPKAERNTIILRDIPASTDSNLLLEAFAHSDGKPVQSIHCDVGDNWFVTMASEQDAIATMKLIQSQKIKFENKSLKARLTSSTVSPRAGGMGGPQHSPRPQQHYNQMQPMQHRHYMSEYEQRGSYGQPYFQQQRPNTHVNTTSQYQTGGGGGYQMPPAMYTMQPSYNNTMSNQYHSPRVNIPQIPMMQPTDSSGRYIKSNNAQVSPSNQFNHHNSDSISPNHQNQTGRSPKMTSQSPTEQDVSKKNKKNNKMNKNNVVQNGNTSDDMKLEYQNDEEIAVDLSTIEEQMNSDNGGISPTSTSDPGNCRGNELIQQLGGLFDDASSAISSSSPMNREDVQSDDKSTNKKKGNGKGDKKQSKETKKTQAKGKPAPTFTSMNFPPLGGKLGDPPPVLQVPPLAQPKVTAAAIVAGRSTSSSTASSPTAASPTASDAPAPSPPVQSDLVPSSSPPIPPLEPNPDDKSPEKDDEVAISFGTISFGDEIETANSPTQNHKEASPVAASTAPIKDTTAVDEKKKEIEGGSGNLEEEVPQKKQEPVVWGKTSFSEVVKKKSDAKVTQINNLNNNKT